MDISNPAWLFEGLLLTILGIVLWRWSARHNTERKLTEANAEATLDKLRGGKAETREHQRERAKTASMLDLTRFVGVVGFLFIIGGLLMMALGLFAAEPPTPL